MSSADVEKQMNHDSAGELHGTAGGEAADGGPTGAKTLLSSSR